MGVVGTLSGVYGADGLGFEDEESSMSVSEFKYAHYDAKQGSFDCNRSVAVWCGFFTSITIHGFSRNEESGVEHFPGFLH